LSIISPYPSDSAGNADQLEPAPPQDRGVNGQALGYFYYYDEPSEVRPSKGERAENGANFAMLPELLRHRRDSTPAPADPN